MTTATRYTTLSSTPLRANMSMKSTPQPAVRERSSEAFQGAAGSGNSGNGSTYIGVDKAKSIAVGHAGFSLSDVQFSKAKLENDDGHTVYEIEFYQGDVEYDYTINAATGAVMEFDAERED